MDWKRHLAVLAVLGCLGGLTQAVLVCRATTPSLDAVRFVRLARAIDRDGLLPALQVQREQPLFPVSVWVVHRAMTSLSGEFRSAWAVSVQLAAAIPLVLAMVPVYFLSMRLWGLRAGMLAALLFCLLPEVVRIGADGISDGLHLFWFAVALWATVEYLDKEGSGGRGPKVSTALSRLNCEVGSLLRYFRRWFYVIPAQAGIQGRTGGHDTTTGSPPSRGRRGRRADWPPLPRPAWLLIAGLATALAALTRAEVLVLPVALAVTIAVLQLRPRWRRAWSRLAEATVAYALGLGLVLVPYLASMNSLAPGPAVDRILGRYDVEQRDPSPSGVETAGATTAWQLASGEPMSFARKDPGTSIRRRGYAAATGRFAGELADVFGYWIGALALVGLGCAWRRPIRQPHLFVALFSVLFSVMAIRFAASEGYLGARHLIVLVVAGIGAAGQGALFLQRRLRGGNDECRKPNDERSTKAEARNISSFDLRHSFVIWLSTFVIPLRFGLVVVLAAGYVVLVVGPLHTSRAPHRRAGEWLAGEATVAGIVVDTRGWTGLYSGRPTRVYTESRAALLDPRLAYVVVEREELERDSRRGRTLRTLIAAACHRAAEFAGPRPSEPERQSVVIYRWNAERFRRWAEGSPCTITSIRSSRRLPRHSTSRAPSTNSASAPRRTCRKG